MSNSRISIHQFYNNNKGHYIKVDGKKAKAVDWNGSNGYAGQCASLVRQYLVQVYGYTNKSYGNAKDYINIPNAHIVKIPRDGDLVVYPNMSEWGHVGIYYKGKLIDQNPNKVTLHALYNSKQVYIRPNAVTINGKIVKMENPQTYQVIAKLLNVRREPTTSSKVYRTLKQGHKFKSTGYIIENGIRWQTYKNIKGHLCYVAFFHIPQNKPRYLKAI